MGAERGSLSLSGDLYDLFVDVAVNIKFVCKTSTEEYAQLWRVFEAGRLDGFR